jgi:hypothetical protein
MATFDVPLGPFALLVEQAASIQALNCHLDKVAPVP